MKLIFFRKWDQDRMTEKKNFLYSNVIGAGEKKSFLSHIT